jgi:hypothetical protein
VKEMLPLEVLQQSSSAFLLSRSLQLVAESAVADALGDDPATASDLAKVTGLHAKALSRVLNLLAAHGIFARRDDRFAHNEVSRMLRTDHPKSLRSLVRLMGLPSIWKGAENLDQAIKTGRVNPHEFWNSLEANPHASQIFNEAMTAKAMAQVGATVAAYDFSQFGLIGDIGGGRGHLLHAILAASPTSKGVLFDLPRVIESVAGMASDRFALCPGDFFRDELPRCDAYVFMEVIHDWPDEESRAILSSVRRAAPMNARLLLIEALIADEAGPSWPRTLDILMLGLVGGSQRTSAEYQTLFADSSFRLERIIDTGAGVSIVEASAA